MRILLFILMMIPMIGISQSKDTWYYEYSRGPKVDTIIKPYVDMFLEDCEKAGVSTKKFYKLETITFSVLPGNISGLCEPKHGKVYIDAMSYANYPDGLKLLVYHELGHCVLGKAHIPNESGLAIMNPTLDFQNLEKYYDQWEAMLIMLFSDYHPKLKDTNDCCPDVDDPCTHNGDKSKQK